MSLLPGSHARVGGHKGANPIGGVKRLVDRWAPELAGLAAAALVLVTLNLLGLGALFQGRFITGLLVGGGVYYLAGVIVNALRD